MKISINARRISGPYGGGAAFTESFDRYMQSRGHQVYRRLVPGLDAIVIAVFQPGLKIGAYTTDEIREYITLNPNTAVVLRANTCDEQRGSDLGANRGIMQTSVFVDHVVFISNFLQTHFRNKGLNPGIPQSVILNGADASIFNPQGRADWQKGQKLKIVTHHWSANFMKGFDIYERLDQLLARKPYKDLFEFTIIGNIPLGVDFKNTTIMEPMDRPALGKELKKHHVYLTATRNEAAGMHHIEGMLSGLPVLYLKSGALPEYCGPYGIGFDLVDFEEKLMLMRDEFQNLRQRVLSCPYTSDAMVKAYGDLVEQLVQARKQNPRPAPGLLTRTRVHFLDRPRRRMQKVSSLVKKVARHLKS